MRHATLIKRIEKMGFGPYLINNADTEEGQIRLGCEYLGTPGTEKVPADYYGEFCDPPGYAWIDPRLIRLAEQADSFWEWENPAVITMYW